jgi:Sulfotransferase family
MAENPFIEQESTRRLASYRTDAPILDTLRRMNEALAPIERYAPSGVARPNLFVFGLPRSGTTLVYQLIAYCLDFGYVSNLAARFWLAPLTGVALARTVLGGRRDGSFRSDYGKSLDPAGPHEFSYFWQRWLGVHGVEDMLRFGEAGEGIDWAGLSAVIGSLQDFFGSGLVHKTNFVANFAPGFVRHVPMPLLIYIERDPEAVALSILKARQAYYGGVASWWATYPPSYLEIKDAPFATQIARQVADLRRAYAGVTAALEPGLVLRLSYDALCTNPGAALDEICDRIARRYGVAVGRVNAAPARFERAGRPSARAEEEKAVIAALRPLLAAAP